MNVKFSTQNGEEEGEHLLILPPSLLLCQHLSGPPGLCVLVSLFFIWPRHPSLRRTAPKQKGIRVAALRTPCGGAVSFFQ